jgi:hypothetical protein
MKPAGVAIRFVRWTILIGGVAIAAMYLNSAAYSAWAAGVPPHVAPDLWVQRAFAPLCYAGVSLALGLGVFLVVRARRVTWMAALFAAAALALLAAPRVRVFVLVDKCLDAGGVVNRSTLSCER